ncbi:hypothetical protein ACFZDI_25465 [Streptomyces sp. NPDC007907]|uniref:hypothetical protein n=1 Tax=Streptomyces sp. NPDC007907 TaxID=3364789 RepID=UPI0036EF165C
MGEPVALYLFQAERASAELFIDPSHLFENLDSYLPIEYVQGSSARIPSHDRRKGWRVGGFFLFAFLVDYRVFVDCAEAKAWGGLGSL